MKKFLPVLAFGLDLASSGLSLANQARAPWVQKIIDFFINVDPLNASVTETAIFGSVYVALNILCMHLLDVFTQPPKAIT